MMTPIVFHGGELMMGWSTGLLASRWWGDGFVMVIVMVVSAWR